MADTIPGNTSTTASFGSNSLAAFSSTIDTLGDTDWFAASLVAGYGYQIWLQGVDSGSGTLADPLLGVYNASGSFITSNDDSGGRDSYLYFTPGVGGAYYFSAGSWANNGTGTYLITLERDALANTHTAATLDPNGVVTERIGFGTDVSDWVSVVLTAGTNYQFDVVGQSEDGAGQGWTLGDPRLTLRDAAGNSVYVDEDSGVGLNPRIFYTPGVTGTYLLDVQASGSGTYKLIANTSPGVGSLTINGVANDSLDFSGDSDLFGVALTAGVTYRFTLTGGTLANPFLELMDSAGRILTYNDDSNGLNSFLSYSPTSSGTYFLGARASGYASTGTYSLSAAIVNDPPTGSVTISGTATQGQTLTASNTLGDLDGMGVISYQWKADGTNIAGATGSTYTLTQSEVGKAMTVVASYIDGFGTAESKTSAATGVVANVNDLPTGGVTIAGTAMQGHTLTAANTLADLDGLGTIRYQWKADGTNIAGATGSTYTLTQTEVGKAMTVVARYTDGYGTPESKASAATALVANVNDPPTGGVTISGTATQGQTLTASNTLADLDGMGAIGYQWRADGANVAGATGSTYTLTQSEVGKAMTVVASYTDGFGASESKTSAVSGLVAPLGTTPPSVSITDNIPGTANGGIAYTLTFSQAVTGLAANDFSIW